METLIVGGKRFEAASVFKLKKDADARRIVNAAFDDGADSVFFALGEDNYVASGKAQDLKGVKAGSPIVYKGQTGRVGAVDNDANTAWEGAKRGALVAGLPSAALLLSLANIAGFAGRYLLLGAAAVTAAGIGIGALYGSRRQANFDALKPFAE